MNQPTEEQLKVMQQQQAAMAAGPNVDVAEACNFRCGLCACTPVLIIGIITFVVGGGSLASALEMNPEVDFAFLGKACNVIHMEHEAYTRSETRTESYKCGSSTCSRTYTEHYCYDTYRYLFQVNYEELENMFKGKAFEFEETDLRYRGRCDDYLDPGINSLTLNNTYECWFPVFGRSSISDRYECPNDDCVKLNDPVIEALEAVARGKGIVLGGKVILSIGGFFCLIFWLIGAYHKLNPRQVQPM